MVQVFIFVIFRNISNAKVVSTITILFNSLASFTHLFKYSVIFSKLITTFQDYTFELRAFPTKNNKSTLDNISTEPPSKLTFKNYSSVLTDITLITAV